LLVILIVAAVGLVYYRRSRKQAASSGQGRVRGKGNATLKANGGASSEVGGWGGGHRDHMPEAPLSPFNGGGDIEMRGQHLNPLATAAVGSVMNPLAVASRSSRLSRIADLGGGRKAAAARKVPSMRADLPTPAAAPAMILPFGVDQGEGGRDSDEGVPPGPTLQEEMERERRGSRAAALQDRRQRMSLAQQAVGSTEAAQQRSVFGSAFGPSFGGGGDGEGKTPLQRRG
jgi:hypothetical protein